jgi:23S rRNA G2445 N2-methylase RlmL
VKNPSALASKNLYKSLRSLSWHELWTAHVPEFDSQDSSSRSKNAALVRAVGVVFSESGRATEKDQVAAWLRSLLQDSDEKIRRYAMAALPKIGSVAADEEALIHVLRSANPEAREKKYLARALDKIGGRATLEIAGNLSPQTLLKVSASVARDDSPTEILLHQAVDSHLNFPINLRGRRGLEKFVRQELEESRRPAEVFDFRAMTPGLVVITPRSEFCLSDLLSFRCCGTFAFDLGSVTKLRAEEIAGLITSSTALQLFRSLTQGAIRYRLDFPSMGHQRGLVREIANRTFALCSDLLNDARSAPWVIEIHPKGKQYSVELRPRFSPDPRFSYRKMDVPAASHPPLAACMARLAGNSGQDVVWDPFCGSGLELIERGRLGGVKQLFGSDRSADAIQISRSNLEASQIPVNADFFHGDFRQTKFAPNSVSQIITNPPMGRRVPIPNLEGLIQDLFDMAARVLIPGGKLVFANPVVPNNLNKRLALDLTERIDLGGFDVQLQRYVKTTK